MSVYTTIIRTELEQFLTQYSVGTLITYQGILAGIENTNYFVTTTHGQFVLTIFEQHPVHELKYFLELMQFWADAMIPTARPIPDQQGHLLQTLQGKPTTLVLRLTGTTVDNPTLEHCYDLGAWLARMHLTGQSFPLHRRPDRGLEWRQTVGKELLECFTPTDAQVLRRALADDAQIEWSTLPQGTIHADLFRDNALSSHHQITGIIDLYYACNDAWLYDLAVVLNDWCFDGLMVNQQRLSTCLQGYQSIRVLEAHERIAGSRVMRSAALRFWLSRALAKRSPPIGSLTFLKDPDEFKLKLLSIIEATPQLEANWHAL